ncbi:hypothetical protein FCE95_01345 [Luteimonas gilva]|uniref:Uncharacterized protein n=1 Tax=Luteimonas gilva TaxID=2572684 RepID=A0A4V5ZQG7_9GAMM|nr:hypothetical protein [Luteimonas gilva]TKR32993.1 hypothetical protein FCE95_01345 [Luteimonas gilva]
MKPIAARLLFAACWAAACALPAQAGQATQAQFEALMKTVAAGWNEGDARKAPDCYTEELV